MKMKASNAVFSSISLLTNLLLTIIVIRFLMDSMLLAAVSPVSSRNSDWPGLNNSGI